MYYRGADATLLVFDITAESSFTRIKDWNCELDSNNPSENTKPIVKVVVGNKVDQESEREVTVQAATAFAESIGAKYFETSAMENIGITEVFTHVAEAMISVRSLSKNARQSMLEYSNDPILLTNSAPPEGSGGCC